MKRYLRDNGLSLALLACFLFLWCGQAAVGFAERNSDAQMHGWARIGFGQYLSSDHFWEATFENWESEFLQMAAYVVITVFLYQRGSSESKDPDKPNESRKTVTAQAPWPVKRGGWVLKLYQHSLSITLFVLFLISFGGHAVAGHLRFNREQAEHHLPPISTREYICGSRFWFESFQNWQSEFLSVAAIVILSIWLREKDSPESKSVASPHRQTGI